jgi:hypothetical protein
VASPHCGDRVVEKFGNKPLSRVNSISHFLGPVVLQRLGKREPTKWSQGQPKVELSSPRDRFRVSLQAASSRTPSEGALAFLFGPPTPESPPTAPFSFLAFPTGGGQRPRFEAIGRVARAQDGIPCTEGTNVSQGKPRLWKGMQWMNDQGLTDRMVKTRRHGLRLRLPERSPSLGALAVPEVSRGFHPEGCGQSKRGKRPGVGSDRQSERL